MECKGAKLLRHRVALSVLLAKDLVIHGIRTKDDSPGITDYEFRFLQLVSQVTNGTRVTINETGTLVRLSPGIITNNPTLDVIEFDCGTERSLAYFIEGILPICLFGKNSLHLLLKGVTNNDLDLSIDVIQHVFIALTKRFGIEEFECKILARGLSGQVLIKLRPVPRLTAVDLTDPGKIKRVRGVAYSSRVSVQMANRVSYATKGFLFNFLPDIWIHTDHHKSSTPLLGVTLVAETTNGALYSAEFVKGEASTIEDNDTEVPEDLANLATVHLLDEVLYGGFVDSYSQAYALFLTALAGGQLLVGRLAPAAIELLRLIKDAAGIEFTFTPLETEEAEEQSEAEFEEIEVANPLKDNLPSKVIAHCVGLQLINMARKAA